MEEEEEWRQFHARNIEQAQALLTRNVMIVGCGAVGSNIAKNLSEAGVGGLLLVDGDTLEPWNLPRHVASRKYLGKNKAKAVVETLKEEIPSRQKFFAESHDLSRFDDALLEKVITKSHVVIAATGNDEADRRLNMFCRELRTPLIVPSMWPNDGPALGDVLVVLWDRYTPHTLPGACFECLRPPRERTREPLEAQRGLGVDITHIATYTADLAIATLFESGRQAWLRERVAEGENYFIVPRLAPKLTPTETMKRHGCEGCLTGSVRPMKLSRLRELLGLRTRLIQRGLLGLFAAYVARAGYNIFLGPSADGLFR